MTNVVTVAQLGIAAKVLDIAPSALLPLYTGASPVEHESGVDAES